MKSVLLFLLAISLQPSFTFGQKGLMVQKVKLGNTKNQATTYYDNPGGIRIINTTYDDILASPKLSYEGSCQIVSYTVTILRDESDIYGPYKITGAELTDEVKRKIWNLKRMKNTEARINIESVELSCPDNNQSVKGELMYTFK